MWGRLRRNRYPGFAWLAVLAVLGIAILVGFLFFRGVEWLVVMLTILFIGYQIAQQIRHERD
jgi:hypothetical protein